MDGVISYFELRKPMDDELDNCCQITMTSNKKWDPKDPTLQGKRKFLRNGFV